MVPARQVHYLVPFAVGRAQRLEANLQLSIQCSDVTLPCDQAAGVSTAMAVRVPRSMSLPRSGVRATRPSSGYGTTAWAGFIPFLDNAACRRIA